MNLSADSRIVSALQRGGTAVVRLDLEGWHYVLLTGLEGDCILVFDPYDSAGSLSADAVTVMQGHDGQYNRIVPRSRFETQELRPYGLGPYETREAVLLFNTAVELTEENTVEYMI